MPDCEQAWLGGLDDADHTKLETDHMLQSHVLLILEAHQALRFCHLMGVNSHNMCRVQRSDLATLPF